MHRVFPRSVRQALLPTLAAALLLSPGLFGQQPGHDAREIAPTPGVTPIETPSSRATARPSRETPGVTRTPAASRSAAARTHRGKRGDMAIAGGHGRGGQVPPGAHRGAADPRSTHDPLQPRDVATWILFAVLVVALGVVTIRMMRFLRLRRIALDLIDAERLL
jgi:hypothetical protein